MPHEVFRIDRSSFSTFESFEEADDSDKRERWNLTPEERLRILERLRRSQYPDGESAPRLQGILESVEFPPR